MPRRRQGATAGKGSRTLPFRRVVVVSNRLPFRVDARGGEVRLRPTVGGLVSGVEAFLGAAEGAGGRRAERLWIGWPGGPVAPRARKRVSAAAERERSCRPVFLSAREQERFYDGFSNRTLWPLFHYFPSFASVDGRGWAAYREVNERFADEVASVLRPGDAVWVHDYHLMLVPRMLRERVPGAAIAFFLHVPFPAFEVFRVLPHEWASEIVEGVLGADVVGFHAYDYARHFLRAAERLRGLGHLQWRVPVPGRVVRVEAFPIGVDFARLDGLGLDPGVRREREELAGALGDRRTILSVDRLDYSKGLLNRVEAFARFLEDNPRWHGRVSLLAIVVPSRERVEAYRAMKSRLEEAIGRINGKYARAGWTPIAYQFRALPFPALAALYAHCPVALVTPLRDGMNLVAKEYLSVRSDETGVLVLSDTSGAARELGEALLVNPYHVESIAVAIRRALEMPVEEQRRRNRTMRRRLARYDVVRWGAEQFEFLAAARRDADALLARQLTPARRARLLREFRAARRRALLLDYDGTLVPLARTPREAAPPESLLRLLRALAADPGTTVTVVSGRDRGTLEEWLGTLPIRLVAEHGAWTRDLGRAWRGAPPRARTWKPRVRTLMEVFADRLPGSFVEEKEFSLAWHYRGADPELGPLRARELAEALKDVEEKSDLQVLPGHRVVEVRGIHANKGVVAARSVGGRGWGFVLAAGDDVTDEDLFEALPAGAWSLRVGTGTSRARYNVGTPRELLGLLAALLRRGGRTPAADRRGGAARGPAVRSRKERRTPVRTRT